MCEELRKLANECAAWEAAGCPVEDEHDTYPHELFVASLTPAKVLQLLDESARLRAAALEVIGFNRQEAQDRYGDANKAESWACIRTLRAALAPTDAAQPQAIQLAPGVLQDALKFIDRHTVNAIKTNSRDRLDWAEDMAYIGKVARDAMAVAGCAVAAKE